MKEIQEMETKLKTEQIKNGQNEAEELLGRPLNNIENLYEAEF